MRLPGTSSFPELCRPELKLQPSPPRRPRKRPKPKRTRLPRVESFYSASGASQGLSTYKEQLGTTRRDRLLAARLQSEPALVSPDEIARAPKVRRQPAEVMEEVSKTFDASRFVNQQLLDSFDSRPFSPKSFKRQLRVAFNVDLSRADVEELYVRRSQNVSLTPPISLVSMLFGLLL